MLTSTATSGFLIDVDFFGFKYIGVVILKLLLSLKMANVFQLWRRKGGIQTRDLSEPVCDIDQLNKKYILLILPFHLAISFYHFNKFRSCTY